MSDTEKSYTPTTDEVRNNMAIGVVVAAYVLPKENSRDVDWPVPGARDLAKAQFDAWLAARDAEQREAGRLAALEEAQRLMQSCADYLGQAHKSHGCAGCEICTVRNLLEYGTDRSDHDWVTELADKRDARVRAAALEEAEKAVRPAFRLDMLSGGETSRTEAANHALHRAADTIKALRYSSPEGSN